MNKKTGENTGLLLRIMWTIVYFSAMSITGHASCWFNMVLSVFNFYIVQINFSKMFSYGKENIVKVGILNFVFTFSLVGNNLFLYPIGEHNILYFLYYGIDYLLLIPQTISILYKLENLSLRDGKAGLSRKIYFIYFFCGFLVIELVYMIALNPGIVSWDDYHVIAEAKGLMGIREYEGLFYIYLKRFLLWICDEIWFLVLVQIIWGDVIFSIIISYFIKEIDGYINWKYSILAALFIMTLPNNSSLIVTLSKDVPWAVCFIWLIYSIIRLKWEEEIRWYIIVEFAVSMSLCWLIRQNGLIVVPFTAVGCLIIFKRKKRIAKGILLAIGLIVLGESITRAESYESTPKGMKYIAMFEDLLGVYYSNGDMCENARDMVENVITSEFKEQYDPYWAVYETWREPLGKIPINEFIGNYVCTFFRNPVRMLESVLLRLDMLWDISLGVNGIETWQWQTYMLTEKWKELVPERMENIFTTVVEEIGSKTTKEPFKEILWRVGIWLQCSFFTMAVLIKWNRRNIVCFIPLGALIVFYVLALGWEHYRYFWCIYLAALLYLLMYLQNKVRIIEREKIYGR